MWIVSEKGEMEGGGARKKNKFIFKMEIAEKSRTDERKEVSEVTVIGQEAWFIAPSVIRSALA